MIVYVITECVDAAYDDEFEGHAFSTREKAQQFLEDTNAKNQPKRYYVEVEVDKRY